MRHVLILAYDFPPRGATGVFRVTKFARYLPEFGWRPVVVTASGEGTVHDEALLRELPPGLEVLRVPRLGSRGPARPAAGPSHPANRPLLRNTIRRLLIPDPQILWLPTALQVAAKRLRRGDIAAIMTTSPPHSMQLGGLWLKRRFPHLPWVMDLRDIWSESPAIHDLATYKANRIWERACLHRADHVVVVTPGMADMLQRDGGVASQRLSVITNGFDPSDISSLPRPDAHEELRLTYVGTILGPRVDAVWGFFNALDRLAADGIASRDMHVQLVGAFAPEIHARAEPFLKSGLLRIRPFLPHAEALTAMSESDVLLLMATDDREGRIAIPNKLFEYLAVGRPILALAPSGSVTELIREVGAGIAVVPLDVDGIVEAVKALVAQHRAGVLPSFARNDARLSRFERRALSRELAGLLDALVAARACHASSRG